MNNKKIFSVLEKHKAYGGIKKALKEKGIRFQTPFMRIQIHWSTSPWT